MSLSYWFRDYVYIPLGGNRVTKSRWLINLLIVWFLTGFWHGADWNFIIWGLFFFVFLSLEKSFLGSFLESHPVLARTYSLLMIGLSWMIFAITDFARLKLYFGRLFSFTWSGDFLYYARNCGILLFVGCLCALPVVGKIFCKIPKWGQVILKLAMLVLSVAYLADASFNPFLYFRF